MSHLWKRLVHKIPKHEQEIYVNTSPNDRSTNIPLLSQDDYQAPRTGLAPNSKWWIVRNNIHKIRTWAPIRRLSVLDQRYVDWYLFFQMRRELRRAAEQIRAIEYRPDFTPVRYFDLQIDETRVRRYNVSHVRPTDGIYHSSLGPKPIVLEYLLYYFSKECVVPYNSIFYSFLSDINAVLHRNRERLQRVAVFRRVALIFALAICIILFIMFFSLILSVFTTTSKLRQMYNNDRDEQMTWEEKSSVSVSTTLIYEQ